MNGKPYEGSRILGVTTSGEFGNAIISLVAAGTKAKATWSHWEVIRGERVAVFRYPVALANLQYNVTYACMSTKTQAVKTAYTGSLFIEVRTARF